MKFATFNICGWKSAIRKGLINWIKESEIEILALQELRTFEIGKPLELMNYFCFFSPSKFQGTALISKEKPMKVIEGIGQKRFDSEARFIQAEFKNFIFINAYLPHGRRDKKDFPYKLEVFDALVSYLSNLLSKNKKYIILAGDFNVAHKEIDLARPKENKRNVMFTLKERGKIDKIIKLGFIDSFRKFHEKGGYTWWLRAFEAKKRNIGWRIDYIFISKNLDSALKNSFVQNLEISDHCPVITDISL